MPSETVKERVVRIAGRCLRRAPASWAARGYFRRRLNIIFYHGIWERGGVRRARFGGMDLEAFSAQIEALGRFFEFVPLAHLLDPAAVADRPRLHLTFDDGLDLVGSGTADWLAARGIAATVFVNTACVENRHLMWQHLFHAIRSLRGDAAFARELNELQVRTGQEARVADASRQLEATRQWPVGRKDEYAAELWRACDMPPLAEFLEEHRPYLDWDALRRWLALGHGVGLHTHSHPFCSRLGAADLEAELHAPLAVLRDRLGLDAVPFAYPFGDRLPPDLEAAVVARGDFSCMLGTGRFSPRGVRAHEMDRVEGEPDLDTEIFGRPLIRGFRAWVRNGRDRADGYRSPTPVRSDRAGQPLGDVH